MPNKVDEQKCLIYKITSLTSKKSYVGYTHRKFYDRWKRHVNDSLSGKYKHKFSRAINKYGENGFEFEILESNVEPKAVKNREKYWINKLDSYVSGYNSTIGGDGAIGCNSKPIYQYDLQGKFIRGYDSLIDVQEICNISHKAISKVITKGPQPYSQGFGWSYVRHDNISPYKILRGQSNVKSILQLDMQDNIIGIFKSTAQASKVTSIPRGSIKECLNGNNLTAYGYKWRKCESQ